MGSNLARDISEMDNLKLEQKLLMHLQNNHYPPIHSDFVETAKKAIEFAQQAIDEEEPKYWEEKIKMPNGIVKTVSGIVEGLHLEFFLVDPDEEYE